jgi:hypothetical protein
MSLLSQGVKAAVVRLPQVHDTAKRGLITFLITVAREKGAEVIGRGLKLPVVSISPEEARTHFGFLGMFADLDLSASSAQTQERLGWHPTGPGLIADLEQMRDVGA